MLVLSRKANEGILIGDSIRVRIIEVRGNKVRLGIEAPADVRVHREELIARGVLDFAFAPSDGEASYSI